MKRLILLPLIFLAACATNPVEPPAPHPTLIFLSVCVSPGRGCTEAIVKELGQAKPSILMQGYNFTSAPFVAKAGIAMKIDSARDIAHNKVVIIDGETVITGSFSFSKAAEDKNAENLLIIRAKALAEKYIKSWEGGPDGYSEPYAAKRE